MTFPTRHATHNRQRVMRNIDIDVLQIVRPRTANRNLIVRALGSHTAYALLCGRNISRRSRQAPTTIAESATLKSGQ